MDREDRDFHQRARLDKQNLIRSLGWTGQSLFDMANARIAACAAEGRAPKIPDLFDGRRRAPADRRVRHAAGAAAPVQVHVPPADGPLQRPHRRRPEWKISGPTFESTLALYQRDQDAFDRGVGAG